MVPVVYLEECFERYLQEGKFTKQMVKSWKVREYEIHHQAVENLKSDGYRVRSLNSVVKENILVLQEFFCVPRCFKK